MTVRYVYWTLRLVGDEMRSLLLGPDAGLEAVLSRVESIRSVAVGSVARVSDPTVGRPRGAIKAVCDVIDEAVRWNSGI